MTNKNSKSKGGKQRFVFAISLGLVIAALPGLPGCGVMSGYSNESLFPEDVGSVYVEMFENRSFRRGVEYELTDALAKRIEAETPYKIISSRDRADTIISGQITSIGGATLVTERETGKSLESQVELTVLVNWKNLKTGELLIDSDTTSASASYSQWQNQNIDYASTVAVNKLAVKIVELMEKQW